MGETKLKDQRDTVEMLRQAEAVLEDMGYVTLSPSTMSTNMTRVEWLAARECIGHVASRIITTQRPDTGDTGFLRIKDDK
jgi:hypothetical protein